MRLPLFELVRERYHRACGYCGVTEVAAGGELTIITNLAARTAAMS